MLPHLFRSLSHVLSRRQVDTEDINITIKTEPDGRDDAYYKCDENGMLQWHASIKYSAATAAALGTTPAIAAAHANDYVAYSSAEFKSLLSAYINDEVHYVAANSPTIRDQPSFSVDDPWCLQCVFASMCTFRYFK